MWVQQDGFMQEMCPCKARKCCITCLPNKLGTCTNNSLTGVRASSPVPGPTTPRLFHHSPATEPDASQLFMSNSLLHSLNHLTSADLYWEKPLPTHKQAHELTLLQTAFGVDFWENLFRCQDLQPLCFFKQAPWSTGSLQKTRANQKAGIWTKNPWSCNEHATFSPLVLSTTSGLAKEATIFYKRLASLLATKWEESYNTVLCWLHCHLSFSLLRSSIQAIRGTRSSWGHAIKIPKVIDLVTSESHLSWITIPYLALFGHLSALFTVITSVS